MSADKAPTSQTVAAGDKAPIMETLATGNEAQAAANSIEAPASEIVNSACASQDKPDATGTPLAHLLNAKFGPLTKLASPLSERDQVGLSSQT